MNKSCYASCIVLILNLCCKVSLYLFTKAKNENVSCNKEGVCSGPSSYSYAGKSRRIPIVSDPFQASFKCGNKSYKDQIRAFVSAM